MISRVHVENFMSLKSVDLTISRFTTLVGKNAVGKSAIFKSLVTLSRLHHGAPLRGERDFQLEPGVNFDDLVWSGNSSLPIRFSVWFDALAAQSEPDYFLEIKKNASGWSVTKERLRAGDGWLEVSEGKSFSFPTERRGEFVLQHPMRATMRFLVHPYLNDAKARPHLEPILNTSESLGTTWRYRPSANDIALSIAPPGEDSAKKTVTVAANGWGVAIKLRELLEERAERFSSIEAELKRSYPHLRSIGFKSDWQGVRLTYLTERSEDPIPAPQEADGVLLSTFLLWRLHTASPSDLICLDEPETGIYPDQRFDRFRYLEEFASRVDGASPRIMIATHAHQVIEQGLSAASAVFKEIRVLRFDKATGSTVTHLSSPTVHDLSNELR